MAETKRRQRPPVEFDEESYRVFAAAACVVARALGRHAAREYAAELRAQVTAAPIAPVVEMPAFRDRLLLRPTEVATALGISRSKVYVMMATGALPSVKVGEATRVPVEALRAWIAREAEESQGDGR